MKIDISDILKHSGASLRLDFSESIKINDFIAEDFDFAKPVTFKGTLVNAGGIIKLDGELWADYRQNAQGASRILNQRCILM